MFSLDLILKILSETVTVDEVFIHPDYVVGQNRANNVGLVMVNEKLPEGYVPYTMSGINSNSSYTLLASGLLTSTVQVYESRFCNANLPQVFCSTSTTNLDTGCTAIPGSPLISGTTNVVGFVLNEAGCSAMGTGFAIEYHNVADFNDWVKKTSGSNLSATVSMFAILSGVLISLKFFF